MTNERFPKRQRLLRRTDFVRTPRCGVAMRSRTCVLLCYLRGDSEPARLGLVASRKMGNAVVRNRAKRRAREWFRRHRQVPAGADVVIILRRQAAEMPWDELLHELDKSLARAHKKARKTFAAHTSC